LTPIVLNADFISFQVWKPLPHYHWETDKEILKLWTTQTVNSKQLYGHLYFNRNIIQRDDVSLDMSINVTVSPSQQSVFTVAVTIQPFTSFFVKPLQR